jgi:hypothetical protein
MNNTTWTGFRTAYARATDTRPSKIKVLNLDNGRSRLVPLDYEVGGGEAQHIHAVLEAAAGSIVRIEKCGQWEKGYYYAVERIEEGL